MRELTLHFMQRFYGEGIWPLLKTYGIDSPPFEFEEEEETRSQLAALFFVAGTRRLSGLSQSIEVVVASPCIDHAEAEPRRLAATVIADLVHGAAISRLLSVPLVSFIGTGQEIRLVPRGAERAAGWHRVAERVLSVFETLELPTGSRCFVSHDEVVWAVLSETVERDRTRLPTVALNGLYHLRDGSAFPAGSPFRYYYEYYRYNLACYRQPVLEHLLGRPLRGMLVVENVQQVKAVALARRLNGQWPTEHLVTVPAPGRAGDERATRAAAQDRLTIDELPSCCEMGEGGEDWGREHRAFWEKICHSWQELSRGSFRRER
ncbi:hypothetical protein KTAU_25620 [Thermogemmatispora aurantia]|uniref:Uncharacterized protein n=1 Tax=Thermogemmatispora aurantia TaxID=2045279 RepID=A0A5J4K8V2_9CHLR|nr:hypothetical protein [Thermogemmatispora aurantia]GER83925.1 hypothetical protein KTAU_25620 [Thermogemmatispora aurantia]